MLTFVFPAVMASKAPFTASTPMTTTSLPGRRPASSTAEREHRGRDTEDPLHGSSS
jgi:hypothetical protein